MNDEEIDEIIKKGSHSTDRWGEATYSTRQAKDIARTINAILQERLDRQSIEIAQKDAKIYAYEAIIANSNFKAVLPKKQKPKEEQE